MNRENTIGKLAKIAIIDDDTAVRLALESLLQENGFEPLPMRGSRYFSHWGNIPTLIWC